MERFQKKREHKADEMKEALEDFPHSFQMKNVHQIKPKAWESLENHLEAALSAGYTTPLETARAQNLLAFTQWQLGKHDEAQLSTEGVLKLEGERHNVVALANKAAMLHEIDETDDANKVLHLLQQLKAASHSPGGSDRREDDGSSTPDSDFDYLLVKARAELAASYLRLGPRFNALATKAFLEVIDKAREPELSMWKLGLAVAYKHALNLQYEPYAAERSDSVTHREAFKLLKEVLDSQENHAGINNLKANAHAEMALLLHSTLDRTTRTQLGFAAHSGPMASCKKALALDDNDPSVLLKTGKIYRHYTDKFNSRKFLEKAVSLQPSSAAYHHLGLTYKAMATDKKHGKLKTRRGGRRNRERKEAVKEKRRLETPGKEFPQPSKKCTSDHRTRVGNEQEDRTRKLIKTPKKSTSFDPEEDNVKLAIKNLKLAVEFSKKENSRAVYDLALMYKSCGNNDQALRLLKEIQRRQNANMFTPPGTLEQVTAFEQIAFIYEAMAAEEEDDIRRSELQEDSNKMFYRALTTASKLFSTSTKIKNLFGQIFHSPSALLKAFDSSGKGKNEKVKIYLLMNERLNKCQDLLKEVPPEERDADFHKTQIEIFAKNREPEKAVAYLAMLRPTEQYNNVKHLFSFRDLLDIYVEAGRNTLMEGAGGCAAYFSSPFREVFAPPVDPVAAAAAAALPLHSKAVSNQPSDDMSQDTDSNQTEQKCAYTSQHSDSAACQSSLDMSQSSDNNYQAMSHQPSAISISSGSAGAEEHMDWSPSEEDGDATLPPDVLLLHDEEPGEELEEKAEQLHNILSTLLGLKVVRNSENFPPGGKVLDMIPENIHNSRLVVILPGQLDILEDMNLFVGLAARRSSTLVLLTGDVTRDKIPKVLEAHRQWVCPPELFAPDVLSAAAAGLSQEAAGLSQEAAGLSQEAAGLSKEAADVVCRFFKELITEKQA